MTFSSNPISLPTTGRERDGERASLMVLRTILEPTFIVREERDYDLGVDGTIEVGRYYATSGKRAWTNQRAYFQIKHTSNPTFLADGSLSYSLEVKNLNYLNSYQLPVLYFVLDYTTHKLYMRWHRDIVQELDSKNPYWLTQKTVDVHFSQLVIHEVLSEIEAEIRAHAAMASLLDDGPGLIRNFSGERPPDGLSPHHPFVGRQSEMRKLEMQMKANSITVVWGISGAGKTELIAHLLNNYETISRIKTTLSRPVALLRVDLKSQFGTNSVLRNLAYSLGVSKLNALSEMNWDEVVTEADARSHLIGEILPARLRHQSVIAVFENSQGVIDDKVGFRELDQILTSDVFRDGAAIIVAFNELTLTGSDRRILKPPIHLESLSPSEAETLITDLIGDSDLAEATVDIVRSIPEVLIPGAIMRGVGVFDRAEAESKSAEALANAVVFEYEPLMKRFLLEAESEGVNVSEVRGFPALAVLGIFRELIVSQELLDRARLELPKVNSPTANKWIVTTSDGYKLTEVTQFVVNHEMRLIFRDTKREESRTELLAAINRFVDTLEYTGLHDERAQKAVEEALSSFKQTAPDEVDLQDRISKLLLPYIVDELIFPLSEVESNELSRRLRTAEDSDQLESQVAQFVTASRFETNNAALLQQLRRTADLAFTSHQLSSRHIRAIDIGISIIARNHSLDTELIAIRQRLLTLLLLKANQDNYEDVAWVKWTSSWALNTVELLLGAGNLSTAKQLLQDVAGLLEKLPAPTNQRAIVDCNQLWIRFRNFEAKLAHDHIERKIKLGQAVDLAREYIAFSPDQEHAISLYLKTVRRLIDEVSTDTERTLQVDLALNEITQLYGDPSDWPLYVIGSFAALIRHEASMHADPERRLERVELAVKLFSPFRMMAELQASEGNNRPLLTLARCYAYQSATADQLGAIKEATKWLKVAIDLTKKAVKNAPSADGWTLLLRLQDQRDHSSLERSSGDTITHPRGSISPALRNLMNEALSWANAVSTHGKREGGLVLWIVQRSWGAEGSLEGHAANLPDLERNWAVLNQARRAEIILKIYNERARKLDQIARRFGSWRDLFLARAINEVQYQRFIALQGNHEYNSEPVLSIFKTAASMWRHDPEVIAAEGKFHRFIWNYADAITSFRHVRTLSGYADLRREATVTLIDTLITASIYTNVLRFPDGTTATRDELLAEARLLVNEIVGFRDVALEASILRDRVEFEAGGRIDWLAIDSAYDMVIGGVNHYLDTIVRNLDELLLEQPELPTNIAEALRKNCTRMEVLQGLGSLYLRKAETGRSENPTRDCERAYAAFDACRILQKSWYGSETHVTSFRRARAILTAASETNNANPFPVNLGRRKSGLDLVESLLYSVLSKSVGEFYRVALERKGQLRALRRRLKEDVRRRDSL